MKYKIFSELTYEVIEPTTYIFNIQVAKTLNQIIVNESISISPDLKFEEFSLTNSENRFLKLQINYGTFTISYNAIVEVVEKPINQDLFEFDTSIIELENDVMPFISPSRHCESDKLLHFAKKEFGQLPNVYSKVKAINDWVFNSIEYISDSTNSSTSACDTLISRFGVCKDFAHLCIAFCRALDIPARYFTGYAANLIPPDIHACFEAYICGQWIIFDPTKLTNTKNLVKIANGKDASEVAVASYHGITICTKMIVQCEEIIV